MARGRCQQRQQPRGAIVAQIRDQSGGKRRRGCCFQPGSAQVRDAGADDPQSAHLAFVRQRTRLLTTDSLAPPPRILRVLAKSAAEQPCQGESGGCKTASLEERPDDSSCSSTGQTPDAAAQPNQVLFVTHTNTLYDVASNEHLDPGMDHSLCSSHAPPLPRAAASVMESGEKNVEAVPIFDCETQVILSADCPE